MSALPERRIDESVVAAWAADIAAGHYNAVTGAFASRGALGPEIVWDPAREAPISEPARFLLRHWRSLVSERELPHYSRLDAAEMGPALGYIALLEVLDGGADFRYRVFGAILADVSGFDMTDETLSAHRASPYIVEFSFAVYRAMLMRREAVLTRHAPPAAVSEVSWERVSLPLVDEADRIARIVSVNVPMLRLGKGQILRPGSRAG